MTLLKTALLLYILRTLPLLTTSIYAESYSVGLNGIPTALGGADLLPADLITPPPPPTSPRPTCAPPGPPLQYSSVGMRFGDEDISYATFDVGDDWNEFNQR